MPTIIIKYDIGVDSARLSNAGCLDAAGVFHVSVTPMPKKSW